MLTSYLRAAVRRLAHDKLHSGVNIAGLAIGLACSILIFLFVRHELSFDEHWAHADRIYRISADFHPGNGRAGLYPAANVQPAAPYLLEDFAAEIEQAARIWGGTVRIRRGETTFNEERFRWADQSFFELFDVEWLRGDPERALTEPFTVVLTESTARKYFGSEDPLGETLLLDNRRPITVTGVIRDFPNNTHLSGTAIASFDAGIDVLDWDYRDNWSFWNFHTYVLLRPGARMDAIDARLDDFIARHKRPGDGISAMTATKLTDVHLAGRFAELTSPGSPTVVASFAAIALCVLLIAGVNFTNLATARAARRAREVGVRKTTGASRAQVAVQFLVEALLHVALAMALAVALVETLLPRFSAFIGAQLSFDYLAPATFAAVAGFVALVALAAGAYPALYLSAFEPVRVLKGEIRAAGAALRGALVVFQFGVSITLVICTAIIHLQTEFARDIERGFRTEQVIVLSGSPTDGLPQWELLAERLKSHPQITGVTRGEMLPGRSGNWQIRAEGADPAGRQLPIKRAGYDLFATYDIEVLAGRTFERERGTDVFTLPSDEQLHTTGAFVLNALAARELGWSPEEAIGKWFEVDFSFDFSRTVRGPVIGVVANTHSTSVREPIAPLAYIAPPPLWFTSPSFWVASVRVTGTDLPGTLRFIEETWQALGRDNPLQWRLLDDFYGALYAAEERQGQVLAAFATLAIAVACLGLFALAAFTTERRTKEIGIRKTLGGGVWEISNLLTAQFGKLVLIGNLAAWPVAYLLMQRWLAGFAYRIEMSPLVFVGGGLLALVIAWVTVGGIAARAAMAKPMLALRAE